MTELINKLQELIDELKGQKKETKATMTLTEAASFLGTSPRTLQSMVKEKVIPCRRYETRYFFSREALLEWLKGRL